VIIRRERPSDYAEVYELVKTSFSTVYTGGTEPDEQDYLNELRGKDCFIPELSLVAEHDHGRLIGQIVLYKTIITTPKEELVELLLSPICVHPDYFRQGIGLQAMKFAFGKTQELGKRFISLWVLVENEDTIRFYEQCGFKADGKIGIQNRGKPVEAIRMIKDLLS